MNRRQLTHLKRNEIRQRFGGMEEDLPWSLFSGNPLQFNAPKAHTLKSVKVEFSPIQSGSGDPSPDNVRPISGWTALDVVRAGENLFAYDDTKATTGTTTAGTTRAYYPLGLSNCTLSFSAELVGSSITSSYINIGKFVDGKLSVLDGFISTTQITERTFAFAENEEAVFMTADTSVASITLNFPKYNICVALGSTASPYSPYTGETTTLSFGQTVFGGTAEVAEDGTATGSETIVKEVYDGSNDEGWALIADGTTSRRFRMATTGFASLFSSSTFKKTTNTSGEWGTCVFTSSYITLNDKNSSIANVSALRTWLSENMPEFAYELATPVSFTPVASSTPTAVAGINTIWSDANGDVTVEARAEAVNLNALQSLNMLLGGRYYNNGTADEPTDEEALDILLGGHER